jgi:hypothetical protein
VRRHGALEGAEEPKSKRGFTAVRSVSPGQRMALSKVPSSFRPASTI